MAKMTFDQALDPALKRREPGMIPQVANDFLSTWVGFSIGPARAIGIFPSATITGAFNKVMKREWEIEGRQWPNLAMATFAWENSFPLAVYADLYRVLSPMTMDQRVEWSWDIGQHFMDMARTPLSAGGTKSHTFLDSSAIWFFYRVLANYLYIVMKTLADAGMDIRLTYQMVRHKGMTAKQSATLNKIIVDLSAKDWEAMGFGKLFSPQQLAVISVTNAKFKQHMAVQWNQWKVRQAALKQKIDSLQAYMDAVKAVQTPFEALRKALGPLGDILNFLGKVPGPVWLAAAAAGGYLFVVRPMLP